MGSVKVGDIVRYLNSVGGGRVVKIDGQVAHVDEDGFETPVLLRECVVVSSGDTFYKSKVREEKRIDSSTNDGLPEKSVESKKPELNKIEETPEGEKLNVVLGFEPIDIKRLSSTSFDAYIVNDSNYDLFVKISKFVDESHVWENLFVGSIEPAMQEFVFELQNSDIAYFSKISIQIVAYKKDKPYGLKPPYSFETKIDATKFFRLHCFNSNPYFEGKVLVFDIIKNDRTIQPLKIDGTSLREEMLQKTRVQTPSKVVSKSSKNIHSEILEVDLHANVLLDNLAGMSKADILNYQIDVFRKTMDENKRFYGKKIVFIHGKGEGVLRQALMKELTHRYKGHDVADASFREYGFGATQVTIRQLQS